MKINRYFPSLFTLLLSSILINSCSVKEEWSEKRDSILKNIHTPEVPEYTVSILSFGAAGDSVTDCKPAFDKAVEDCRLHGGGKITVPAGMYVINGPLHLTSNLCLDIQKGAVLKFSSDPSCYLPVVLTSWEGTFLYNYSPFIYGYQLKNITITGEGTIDGNASDSISGWSTIQADDQMLSRKMNHENIPLKERIFGEGHYLRPHLIQLFECKNILIKGVTVTNSPFWCIHLLRSENVTLRKIAFDAQNKNNDGIDPEYSRNILIEDIDFNNGDDNVAIKAGRDHEGRATNMPSENIIIRNCRFKGLHGVVIGSEMSSGVQNVFVENCSYGGYLKRGIYLKSNPDRGGYIKDIFVDHVEFGEVEDCFFITSYYHGEGEGFSTDIHDIYIRNVTCKKARNAAIVVQGYPEKKVRDIYLTNVTVDTASVGVNLSNAENIVFNEVNIGGMVSVPSHVQ